MEDFNNNNSNKNNNYNENLNNNNKQDVDSDNTFNSNMFNNNQNENNNAFNNMFSNISNPNYSSNQNVSNSNYQNSNFNGQQWQGNNVFPQQPVQNSNFQPMQQQMPNVHNNINYNQQGNVNGMPYQNNEGIEIEYSVDNNNNYQNNNDFRKAYTDEKQKENFSGLNDLNLFDDDNESEDELRRAALSYRNKSIMLKIITKGLILLILLGAAVLIYFAATYFLDNNKVSDMKGINDILSEDEKYKTEYKEKLDKDDFAFLKDDKAQPLKDEDKPARKLQSRFMVQEEEMQNKSIGQHENGSIANILGKEDFSTKKNTKPQKVSKPQSAKKASSKTKMAANSSKNVKVKPKVSTKSAQKAKVAPKSVQKSAITSNTVSNAKTGYWQVQVYSATDLEQTQKKWRDLRTEYELFDNIEGHPIAASIKGKVYYRLRVGPRKVDQFNPEKKVGYFMNKSDATKFCTNLKGNGIDCFVTLTEQDKL